jgi:hypothetical protein
VRTPALNAPVEVISCFDRTAYFDWTYTYPGDNLSFQLKNTTLCAPSPPSAHRWLTTRTGRCLDAGTNPHDGGALKLYTCYPGLAAQRWWFTYDERIALTGDTHQCVDYDNTPGGRGLQTWTCTDKDTHQVWTPSGPF